MKVRNKEHQSLGVKELKQLCKDFPNDQQLGEEIRKIYRDARAAAQPITRSADELRAQIDIESQY